jgi:hypothetical protein
MVLRAGARLAVVVVMVFALQGFLLGGDSTPNSRSSKLTR